jgi:hypothetical protein
MNMQELKIVDIALENLNKFTNIFGRWENFLNKDINGKITFEIDYQTIVFFAEIKKEIRQQQLQMIEKQARNFNPLMVIAERIYQNIKEELRQKNIAYLEANGNIFIKHQNIYLWIDTQKPIPKEKENNNRVFTKTGLKVVFNFLLDNELINLPYRDIAERTAVALGIITYVFAGLKEKGFIIQIGKKRLKLLNKIDLLKLWVERYDEKLKPVLHIGTFRFMEKTDFNNWRNIQFKNKNTFWGGEPAAALLTKYLNPGILTLYTTEAKTDLMKNFKLIPDPEGNVKIYQKFWLTNEIENKTVPPILIYADLINTGNSRNIETAEIIFKEHINDKY